MGSLITAMAWFVGMVAVYFLIMGVVVVLVIKYKQWRYRDGMTPDIEDL